MSIAADQQMHRIAKHIEEHADEPLTLDALGRLAGLSAGRLQRVFKKTFGVSPKAYQDAVRMRQFKQSLRQERNVTDAIYASGFGSSSRVYGEATRNLGMTPQAYRKGGKGEVIAHACRKTSLGLIVMAATDKGVCFVQFGDDEAELVSALREEFPHAELTESPAQNASELDAWIDALNHHLSDGAPAPDLPLDMRGTAFQMRVWRFLLSIREGDVLSYSDVAAGIGQPSAVRAVASACGRNRIAVLIPCHRVLRSNGGLGGYRWGLARKKVLLNLEKR